MKQDVEWTRDKTFFRAVTEKTNSIAWATDPSGSCFYISPEWYIFTGAGKGESAGFDWMNMIHPEDVAKVGKAFFHANETRTAYGMGFRLARADGQYEPVWDIGLPKFGEAGDFQGFCGTLCLIGEYQSDLTSALLEPTRGRVLTGREREILKLISHGNTSDNVAAILGIAGRTVDAHIANAGAKLGASNRIHAVATALRLNEI